MKKIIIALLLSNAAFAHAAASYDSVRLGIQGTQVKSHSFGSYLGNDYNPNESKDLGGFYLDGSLAFNDHFYGTVDLTGVTRASSDIDNHFFGVGYHFDYGFNSLYTSVGANMVEVARNHSNTRESKFDETAVSLEAGAKLQLTSFFAIQPQYRLSFFNKGHMHDYRLINELMLTDCVSLEAGIGYNKFIDAEQFNWQGGMRFSF